MMRIPGSSEKSAFSILLMFVLWSVVAVVFGVGIASWVGLVVFGVGAVAALLFLLISREPEPRHSLAVAAHSPHPHGGGGAGLLLSGREQASPGRRGKLSRFVRSGRLW